jgi:hypothetical protein
MSDDGKTLAANATPKAHKEDLSTANAAKSDADGGATQASVISRGRRKLCIRPRFMSIPHWCDYSGMGRTATYELMAKGQLRTIKVRKRRLVDVDFGVAYLDSLAEAAKGLKTVDRAVDTPRPPPELIRTSAAEGQPVPLRGRRP